jgi:hypothetical protein
MLRAPAHPGADPALRSVVALIRERDRFVVTAHRNPEGDALGSILGLGGALLEMGKQVVFYNADPVPRVLRAFPFADRVVNSLSDALKDTAFVCDCGSKRVGGKWSARRLFRFVNLDHHVSSRGLPVSYIDPSVGHLAPGTGTCVAGHQSPPRWRESRADSCGHGLLPLLKHGPAAFAAAALVRARPRRLEEAF